LRKAYQTGEGRGRRSKTGVQPYLSEEEFIQSIKQPKTPTHFLLEKIENNKCIGTYLFKN